VKKDGPTNVKSGDIQVDNEDAQPVNDEIALVKLKEDQELEFEATAVLGNGREHAKHQGGTVGYKKDGDDFHFRIESTSGYTNEELLKASIKELQQELEDFKASI
jgi:DNA-directed RNA polymerase alpha subunit